MQKYVSCSEPWVRVYLYNFYGSIFNDPSVVVDEASYLRFKELMDAEMEYCAQKGLHSMEDVYYDENFGESYTLLEDAFGTLGITMEITKNSDGHPQTLIFTLPSGEQKILECYNMCFNGCTPYVRARLGVTDTYLEQIRSYYQLEEIERCDLEEDGCNVAGNGTWWTHDEATGTLEITGEGSLVESIVWGYVGIELETVSTMIVGAGVKVFDDYSLSFENVPTVNIVTLHGEADELTLGETVFGSFKSERTVILYTDNTALMDYLAANYAGTIDYFEIHSLAEWEG
ncbi:MAG: hypothetical protein IJX94_01350 [Clostridia bacterium]|nr:hypothetical protein [Clostridia bacterium]